MLMTLLAGASLFLMQGGRDTSFTVPKGTRLELNTHAGEITVRTWNRDAIQVGADHSDRDRFGLEISGGVARIRTISRRMVHMSTDYRLTVPAWMDLELSTVNGDIAVDGSQARVNVTSIEGNVRVRGGKEFVSVHSVEGEVDISQVTGRLEVNAVDGNITITDLTGAIFAEAIDGDIIMERIRSEDVDAATVDGNITYRGTVAANGRYRFGSHDGDIDLEVPEPLDAVLSISTYSGAFQACGYSVVAVTEGERQKRRFRFSLGTGSARIDMESFDGTMTLRKPGCSAGQ